MSEALHNVEAEQSVIGGLLLENDAFDKIAGIVHEHDFSSRDHRMIFRACARLIESGKPADLVTVAEFLDSHKLLEDAGGIIYIGELIRNTPSAANIRRYAEVVREYATLRKISAAATEISELLHNRKGQTSKEILDLAQSRMMNISESAHKSGSTLKHASDVMDSVIRNLDEMHSNPRHSDITGLATGLTDLDTMTTGLQPGELIILAARPSMGKTSLALNIMEHVALDQGKNVAFFSLEMINDQLGMRLLSSVAKVNQQRVRVARLNDDEFKTVYEASRKLRETGIYLDEESNITVTELRARARRLHRECGGLHLVIIDYLQLMSLEESPENEAIALAKVSRSLKLLAKELHVPIIALSQLNRGLEQRPNKRPVMSDLRGSGGIEQDADMIMFIYRDEVYNEDSLDAGVAEIIVGKQRNGPIGTVCTSFQKHLMRFENMARGFELPSRTQRASKRQARAGGGNFRDKNEPEYVDF